MTLKIKRLDENAIMPIRAHKTDAGIDLTCLTITQEINECGQLILVYHSGIAVDIPEGYVGLLFQRSSVSNKSLSLTNAVGIIDAGYHGEVIAKFKSTTDVVPAIYKPGERFVQLVFVKLPDIEIEEVTDLGDSERGEGGYGSTDNSAVMDSEQPNTVVEPTNEQAAESDDSEQA